MNINQAKPYIHTYNIPIQLTYGTQSYINPTIYRGKRF